MDVFWTSEFPAAVTLVFQACSAYKKDNKGLAMDSLIFEVTMNPYLNSTVVWSSSLAIKSVVYKKVIAHRDQWAFMKLLVLRNDTHSYV